MINKNNMYSVIALLKDGSEVVLERTKNPKKTLDYIKERMFAYNENEHFLDENSKQIFLKDIMNVFSNKNN